MFSVQTTVADNDELSVCFGGGGGCGGDGGGENTYNDGASIAPKLVIVNPPSACSNICMSMNSRVAYTVEKRMTSMPQARPRHIFISLICPCISQLCLKGSI